MIIRPAYLAATVALILGGTGLLVGALPRSGTEPAARPPAASRPVGVSAGDITVSGAYVRQPASPGEAAAYFVVTNTGGQPDTLLDISTGAAAAAVLHDLPGVTPAGAGQHQEHQPAGLLTIAPGATITLSPGHGHLMLEGLIGPLRPGDRVSLLLDFQRAGRLLVEAPVIAIAAPAPTGGS